MWTRQRYQLAPPESLRSRPQLENSARTHKREPVHPSPTYRMEA